MAEAGNKNLFLIIGIMLVVAVAGVALVLFLDKGYQSALAEEPAASSNQQANEMGNAIAEKPISQKIAGKSDSTIDACVDSDSGKDYYVKGKAVWRGWQGDDFCEVYNAPGGWTQIDSCIAGDRSCSVAEKYCDSSAPNNIGQENKYCEYGCKDGACLKEELKSDLIITKAARSVENEKFIISFSIGNIGKGSAVSPLTQQYKLIGVWGKINGNDNGWFQIPTDNNGVLLQPNEERNVAWELYLASIEGWLKEGKNEISLFVDRTYKEGTVVNLPNGYIEESNEDNNDYLLKFAYFKSGQNCIDSDGGVDYYKKGEIYWIHSTGAESYGEDFCTTNKDAPSLGRAQTGKYLFETACAVSDYPGAHEIYECPSGCRDGVCIELG